MSAIDVVIQFYRLLNVSRVTSLLNGGRVYSHSRPLNSTFTDVVITIPEYVGGSFNKISVEINIHTPNLKNYNPIGIDDDTYPNTGVLKVVTDAVLELLEGYNLTTSGKLIRDKDGHWYSNIIVDVQQINESESIEMQLLEYLSADDGFGGSVPYSNIVWTGSGVLLSVANNVNDFSEQLGRYEMNAHVEFAMPSTTLVKKNMSIRTLDGLYIVKGVRPMIGTNYTSIKAVKDD